MVKNSHSLQLKLSKNHHQNRAVEVASLSKRTSALRKKVRDLSLDFQSKKMLNYLSSNFGSLHRPIPFPKISAISL